MDVWSKSSKMKTIRGLSVSSSTQSLRRDQIAHSHCSATLLVRRLTISSAQNDKISVFQSRTDLFRFVIVFYKEDSLNSKANRQYQWISQRQNHLLHSSLRGVLLCHIKS